MTNTLDAFAITGQMLIGNDDVDGTGSPFHAIAPSSGLSLEPAFASGTASEVARACEKAQSAFDTFRETSSEQRAALLERVAVEIEAVQSQIVKRAELESGLSEARLIGEVSRTIGQLRMFGSLLRSGSWPETRIEYGDAKRTPLPRPDLRLRYVAVGPVAVFGASNFPLAFSVAGGDTAAALAAGCPVVFKGHPAHPGTSELVGRAVRAAVQACDLPEGVFSLLSGADHALGAALVVHPTIKSVAFTGSRRGGLALMELAARRPEPIPVHAEMGSINPVFLLPDALEVRGEALAAQYVNSLTLGAGQFCTNPGLVVGIAGPALDRFVSVAIKELIKQPSTAMLASSIHAAYKDSVEQITKSTAAELLAKGEAGAGPYCGTPAIFRTNAETFASNKSLANEIFGPSSLVVTCTNEQQMCNLAESLEGQLTATLQCNASDLSVARSLTRILEKKAGRILFNGWPTGVEVSPAMVHGGPFPASSDSRSTSVGTLAIQRFVRPICYQDWPYDLLPSSLQI